MAERKAVNKYYPPDWEPKKGSINKYRGSHPLRERARKLHEGILIIRFELPYNIWCLGCNNHIGMGVRYNAQKSKTGMYYSTPIYKFRMKCHLCDNHFEIQTDPQNHDYLILNGARRQENRWEQKDNEQVETEDKSVIKKLQTDSMFKLEHEIEDKAKAKANEPVIEQLEQFQGRWRDDYACNSLLRHRFRNEKKDLRNIRDNDDALLKKSSLNMKLLPEVKEDLKLAKLMKLEPSESYETRRKTLRKNIINSSIFKKYPQIDKIPKLRFATKESKDNSKIKLSKETLGIELRKSSINNNTLVADYSDSE